MEPTSEAARFTEALTRLNESAALLERRLAEVRAAQAKVQQFLEELERLGSYGHDNMSPVPEDTHVSGEPSTATSSFTDEVVELFQRKPREQLNLDDVMNLLQDNNSDAQKGKVRNALYYAVRLGKLERGQRRGTFTLKDTSTPVATGVEGNEEPEGGSS
jgi:hypothetical protein